MVQEAEKRKEMVLLAAAEMMASCQNCPQSQGN